MARHLHRAEIETAWSVARELGQACHAILAANNSKSPLRVEAQAQRIAHLWSGFADQAALIQKACTTFARFDSRSHDIGLPGNCVHQATVRFAGRVKQETWNATIYAILCAGVEGLPNSSGIVQHWDAVQKSLDSIGAFNWEVVEVKLEREAMLAIEAISKREQLASDAKRSVGQSQDPYCSRRAAFAQTWLYAGLSWIEIAAKYRQDSRYKDDSEFDVNKLQSAFADTLPRRRAGESLRPADDHDIRDFSARVLAAGKLKTGPMVRSNEEPTEAMRIVAPGRIAMLARR